MSQTDLERYMAACDTWVIDPDAVTSALTAYVNACG